MVDLAIGVMIGAAFGKIVSSLVTDIFTPILSLITGKIDFSTLAVKFGSVKRRLRSTTACSSSRSSTFS